MGMQDRDWYRDLMREREKAAQMAATKSKFTRYTKSQSPQTRQMGLIPMMVFWFAVMGVLYVLMNYYLKPKPPTISANGDLTIKRSADGHFYTLGAVNGYPVQFMIDTGATLVAVSDSVAQKAFLTGGTPTTFQTANGDRAGRVVDGVGVSIGPVSVTGVKVGVGLSMADENQALLGQSFLSKFSITMDGSTMVLKPH